MKIAVIGAGNMGGSIVRALGTNPAYSICVSNPTEAKLKALKDECPAICTTHDNATAAKDADCIILAVKPWLLQAVINEIASVYSADTQILISIAGGVSLDALVQMLPAGKTHGALYHVIPDTAISVGHGMTFVAGANTTAAQDTAVSDIFATMGEAAIIPERLMPAVTALSSCGIAFAYKYVQACVQAGVQMGLYPADALKYTIATVDGALEMLRHNGTLPQQEIDRVTTPGGMTIRGINALEATGFTHSVISSLLATLKRGE